MEWYGERDEQYRETQRGAGVSWLFLRADWFSLSTPTVQAHPHTNNESGWVCQEHKMTFSFEPSCGTPTKHYWNMKAKATIKQSQQNTGEAQLWWQADGIRFIPKVVVKRSRVFIKNKYLQSTCKKVDRHSTTDLHSAQCETFQRIDQQGINKNMFFLSGRCKH